MLSEPSRTSSEFLLVLVEPRGLILSCFPYNPQNDGGGDEGANDVVESAVAPFIALFGLRAGRSPRPGWCASHAL